MDIKKELKNIQKALLTGVSYMMPLVVAGGIIFSVSLLGATPTESGLQITSPFMANLKIIGSAGLFMMIPVFGAYIAYSIAGRPGLVPGFILGYICNNTVGDSGAKTGFLGALVMGVLAGYLVRWMKGWKVSEAIKAIMPIIIMPVISVFTLGVLYIYVISTPLGTLINILMNFLQNLNGTNQLLFAIAIGALCEIDMGGPLTKSVSMFTLALISEGMYGPNGLFRICCGIPPMAICLSTFLFPKKWSSGDKTAAKSAGIMGFMGITEGAIPFVINDFKHVLPANIIGCIVGSVVGSLMGVESMVPHGSFITLPMVTNKVGFAVAIIAGTVVAALIMGITKKPVEEEAAPAPKTAA